MEDHGERKNRPKQRKESNTVERWGIAKFDKAGAGGGIFDDREHSRKKRLKRHDLDRVRAGSGQNCRWRDDQGRRGFRENGGC